MNVVRLRQAKGTPVMFKSSRWGWGRCRTTSPNRMCTTSPSMRPGPPRNTPTGSSCRWRRSSAWSRPSPPASSRSARSCPGPCLREVIYWLPAAAGITGPEAYALASMAVSFRVTQYANQTGSAYTSIPPKAVHAVIPKAVFPDDLRARIAAWLRP